MANPPIAPDYDKYHNSTIFGLHRLKINSSLGQLQPSGTDMRKVETIHAPAEANVQTKPRILLPELLSLEPPPQ